MLLLFLPVESSVFYLLSELFEAIKEGINPKLNLFFLKSVYIEFNGGFLLIGVLLDVE